MTSRREILIGAGAMALGGLAAAGPVSAQAKPFRILAVDGGGMKGVVAAEMLLELDARLKAAGKGGAAQTFDLFAGTSTGCIIAAALASSPVGPSPGLYENPERILEIYSAKGGEIFKRGSALDERLKKNPFDWWGQSYSSAGKEAAFLGAYGGVRLKELTRNFVGTFYSMGPGEPGAVIAGAGPLYREKGMNRHDGYLLRDIVNASSAAPVYFNPAAIKEPATTGVDGGIFANNPSAAAFFSAGALVDPATIQIVSLGCGRSNVEYPTSVSSWGPVEWVAPKRGIPLINLVADSQSSAIDTQLSAFLGSRYVRFQPSLANLPKGVGRMDDPSAQNLNALRGAARLYLARPEVSQRLSDFVATV